MMTFTCCSTVIVVFNVEDSRSLRPQEVQDQLDMLASIENKNKVDATPAGVKKGKCKISIQSGTELTPLQLGSRRGNVRTLSESCHRHFPLSWKIS